jgi:hypothetical protein
VTALDPQSLTGSTLSYGNQQQIAKLLAHFTQKNRHISALKRFVMEFSTSRL